jgi:hypothetical protein
MSNPNMVAPLIDALFDTGVVLFNAIKRCATGNKYDFKDLFTKISFKNKADEYPKLIEHKEEEYFKTYKFKVPVGITLEDFKDRIEKIAFFMGVTEKDIRIEKRGYDVVIKIMTKRPNAEYDPETMKRKDFRIPLGYSLNNNEMVYWDIIKPSDTHCYIAGSSGGGKSVTLRLIMSHLVNSKSKRDIEFSIVNTKRVDLKDFQHCKNTVNYMTGVDGVEDFLEAELEEMERRYRLLEKKDCDDLTEYRKKVSKIPYRLIIIEEISSYKGNKEYQRSVELLASQGRGAGMILILVTQLPSHEIMPNTIKCNINVTIGLKTKDHIRSEIIAGSDSGLENLKGDGHSKLFSSSHEGTEYQGLYISKEMMKDIINANLKENKRAAVGGTTTTQGDNKKLGQ